MPAPPLKAQAAEREWRRLRYRLRRFGTGGSVGYVLARLRTGGYPPWCAYMLADRLIKLGEAATVVRFLEAVRRAGSTHPLLDVVHAKAIWCVGDRKKAIRFLSRKARLWSASVPYHW